TDGEIKSRGSGHLRPPGAFTPALARFLGLLVAEGRNTAAAQVWFVNSDPALIEDFAQLARELFGLEAVRREYKPGAQDVLLFSRPLCKVLERWFRFPFG